MSTSGFLRLKKLKGRGIVAVAAKHNRRAIQAEVGSSASIDANRSRLNETLHGPATAGDVAGLARECMRRAGVGKLRKDAVMAVEIVFSLPLGSGIDDRGYFSDCVNWAARNFGGFANVLSADVHRDEATPHCHVLLLPLVGGKMAGSDLVGDKKRLQYLHQDFHCAVAGNYGLKKAPGRLTGAAKQTAVAAALERLRDAADGALTSLAWPAIRDAIERDPIAFTSALGIIIQPVKKKQRTMTQIFTSKGKGKSAEKPIGFHTAPSVQTLSCVGFDPVLPHREDQTERHQPTPPRNLVAGETVRVREDEMEAANFDPASGEFIHNTVDTLQPSKTAARAWVKKMFSR